MERLSLPNPNSKSSKVMSVCQDREHLTALSRAAVQEMGNNSDGAPGDEDAALPADQEDDLSLALWCYVVQQPCDHALRCDQLF